MSSSLEVLDLVTLLLAMTHSASLKSFEEKGCGECKVFFLVVCHSPHNRRRVILVFSSCAPSSTSFLIDEVVTDLTADLTEHPIQTTATTAEGVRDTHTHTQRQRDREREREREREEGEHVSCCLALGGS